MKTRIRKSFRPTLESLEHRLVPTQFVVNTTADTLDRHVLSLRRAIDLANAHAGPDTILLPAGTYTITRVGGDNTNFAGDFDVTSPLTIVGRGATPGATVVQDNLTYAFHERLFDVLGKSDIAFVNLTLKNGGKFTANGAAVQALTANILLNDCVVTGSNGLKGGAINAEAGRVTLRNSTLTGNVALGNGGAVCAGPGGVVLDNTTMTSNVSNGRGGAVLVALGDVAVSHSFLSFNTALNGGAIDDDVGNVSIRDGSSLHDNTTKGEGGAVFDLGTLTLVGSSVSNNRSGIGGGGLSATRAVLTSSVVSGNQTDGFGGGLSAVDVALVRSTVFNNGALGDGGGVFAVQGATLTDSTVDFNRANGIGGGIHAQTANVTRSTINDNRCLVDGAGLFADTVKLTNTTVSDNVASRNGGGVYANKTGDLLNCTIVLNHAGVFGGGVLSGGEVRVKNTIIALDTVGPGGNFRDVAGLFVSQGHNLVQDFNSGAANTNFTDPFTHDILGVDPNIDLTLRNNGGPTQTHALLAGSRAIDAGDNAGAPGTDQRGVARPRDGDGNGSKVVDIGAFEK